MRQETVQRFHRVGPASTIPEDGNADSANVTSWTEATLLDAPMQERTITGNFAALPNDLEPARQLT